MELFELTTKTRHTSGKGACRSLRRNGQFPAILYGPENAPQMLAVNEHEFDLLQQKVGRGQMMVSLVMDTAEAPRRLVLLKELQRHPVSRRFIHADFYEIAMNRKITVRVPVVMKGKSRGVEDGGMLQVLQRQLDVRCFPNQIPAAIEINITDLDIGDALHVSDITLSEGIEIATDPTFAVVTVVGTKPEDSGASQAAEG